MKRLYVLQVCTCSFVLLILASAEGAALLLQQYPASTMLWYLNLEVFRPIQQATYSEGSLLGRLGGLTGPAAVLLCLTAIVMASRARRFPLAVISHLCLILIASFGRDWLANTMRQPETASLDPSLGTFIRLASAPDAALMASFCLAAVTAVIAGHLTFLWKEGGRPTAPRR